MPDRLTIIKKGVFSLVFFIYCMRILPAVFFLIPLLLVGQKQPREKKLQEYKKINYRLDSISRSNDSIVKELELEIKKATREIENQKNLLESSNLKLDMLDQLFKESDWTDKVGLLIAFVSGVVLTIISLILSNVSSIRNRVFKEFRTEIFINKINTTDGDKITLFEFYLEMNSKIPEEVLVNYAYFKISDSVSINSRVDATLGDQFLGESGRFYFSFSPTMVKQYHREKFAVIDKDFLGLFDNRKRKAFKVIVNTSKYGNVSSNTFVFRQGRNSLPQIISDWFKDKLIDIKQWKRRR